MSNIKYVISATDQTADAWRSAESTANASLNKMSAAAQMSAKQFTAAMRYVPAQFTDIVVGLSTGQNPLTVMLQQGGQLKDMFGGVGNAAKALGMYVAGLVNPFSVAAAAGAGLAYAYNAGAEESSKLAKAVIMSGNAAGVTAGQLSDLSKSISAATGATRSEVADVLEQAVATGEISADNLSRVSAAAIAMEQATGRAVGETIRDFVELGKEPVEASLKLTSQHHYLTAEIYKQIQALEDQGRKFDAGALAQKAYADAMSQRTKDVIGNLGVIEAAWKAVSDGAKQAWNSMLGVGRKSSIADQIAEQKRFIEDISSGAQVGNIDVAQRYLVQLQAAAAKEKEAANAAAAKGRSEEAQIAWLKEGEKYLSKHAQMEREIAKARGDAAAAGVSGKELSDRIAAIREKYKESTPKGKKVDINAGFDESAAKAYADAFKALADITEDVQAKTLNLVGSEALLHKVMTSPEWARMPEPWREVIQKQYEAAAAAEQVVRADANIKEAYERTIQPLRDRLAELEKENDLYGLTEAQLNTVVAARIDEAAAIARANGAGVDQIATLERERDLRLEIATQAGKKDLRDSEVKRIQEEADQMKRIGDDIGASLTDAIFRGGANGYKMLKATIESTIIRATILPMVQGQINGLLGAITGSGAGAATKKATEGEQGSSMLGDAFDWLSNKLPGLASLFSANGNIFERGQVVHAFANGGVVSSATPFRYAGGLGVMGEAGPEAILPLRRTAAGKLGVVAQTNAPQPAQAPTPAIHINFNVTGQVDSRTAQQMATQAGTALQRALRRNG